MDITIKGLQALLLCVKTRGSHFFECMYVNSTFLGVTHYRLSDTSKCKLVQLNLDKNHVSIVLFIYPYTKPWLHSDIISCHH